MIDILKQHARERRLTVFLFIAAAFILILIQWRIGALSVETSPPIAMDP